LDPNLVATVMQIESCGNPHAVSRSGAQGLFQVMPFHFAGGEDMQDPETNARRGLVYLAESLLQSKGDIRRALAGYNGGHGVIGWDPSQWSAETQRYAYWGDGIFADAARGRKESPRLQEWLAAGGAGLCADAG
jgi:soluble lytic murein transglycosylase-like protein